MKITYRLPYIPIILLSLLSLSCTDNTVLLEQASTKYKQNRDYASLEIIYKKLSKGMPRKDVERLLGEPDYSPIDGQYYYSSNHSVTPAGQSHETVVGLVIDYRDKENTITTNLQEFWLGPIGE